MKKIFLFLALMGMSACTTSSDPSMMMAPEPMLGSTFMESDDCEGAPNVPDGYTEVDDTDLIARAIGSAGEGKLCQADAIEKTDAAQVKYVYRAWNGQNEWSKYGKWWTFTAPSGTKATYREDYEICESWNTLEHFVKCELEDGQVVAIGPGQSVTCPDGDAPAEYGQSAANQVYIEGASAKVTNCEAYDPNFQQMMAQQ